MQKLIGISGKMGSGKDTVAQIIRELSAQPYQIRRFAGKVKEIASLLTGIPVCEFEKPEFKKEKLSSRWGGMTVRELLQKIGTDCIRDHLHPDAWVNALFAGYMSYEFWIIPDTRFANEYLAIKDRGGIIIRVERPGIPASDHVSETALDGYWFDYVIQNNGSLTDLAKQVKEMMDTWH